MSISMKKTYTTPKTKQHCVVTTQPLQYSVENYRDGGKRTFGDTNDDDA